MATLNLLFDDDTNTVSFPADFLKLTTPNAANSVGITEMQLADDFNLLYGLLKTQFGIDKSDLVKMGYNNLVIRGLSGDTLYNRTLAKP